MSSAKKCQELIWEEVILAESGSYQVTCVASWITYRHEGNLHEEARFVLYRIQLALAADLSTAMRFRQLRLKKN